MEQCSKLSCMQYRDWGGELAAMIRKALLNVDLEDKEKHSRCREDKEKYSRYREQ